MKFSALLVGIAAIGILSSQPAMATPIVGHTYTLKYDTSQWGWQNHGYLAVNLHNSPTPSIGETKAVAAGGFAMQNVRDVTTGTDHLPPWQFQAFCIDIFNWLKPSFDYVYETGDSYFTSDATVEALGRLASNHLDDIVDRNSNAAFQLAVWEIVNENSGNWDITKGSFSATAYGRGNITDAANLANAWLNTNLAEQNNYDVFVYNSTGSTERSQSLAVFAEKIPVPEPGMLALFGLGLMGLGVSARRKKA